MTCDPARRLFDDYSGVQAWASVTASALRRTSPVAPLAVASELRALPALDHQLRLVLGASVQSVRRSPDANARITRAAQASVRRGIWLNRADGRRSGSGRRGERHPACGQPGLPVECGVAPARPGGRLKSPLRACVFIQGDPPLRLMRGLRGCRAPSGGLYPGECSSARPAWEQSPGRPLTYGALLCRSWPAADRRSIYYDALGAQRPGSAAVGEPGQLDINGPQRSYHFELTVSDPLPRGRVSALRITPVRSRRRPAGSGTRSRRLRSSVRPDSIPSASPCSMR